MESCCCCCCVLRHREGGRGQAHASRRGEASRPWSEVRLCGVRKDVCEVQGEMSCPVVLRTQMLDGCEVQALSWTSELGIRVGAYVTAAGDIRHVTMSAETGPAVATGNGCGPSFEMVQELERVLRQGEGSSDAVVVACRVWLSRS